VLYAVLQQPFITSDTLVDLEDIKKFLRFNDFENSKRNDYIHKELGLILEDMHDENVIVNSDTLFFIDTVFYTVTPGQG
jgi:Serine/Threonine/Tyrosine Kinase found in polyvalent proteins